ncbi:MAG: hypothetical protein KIT27_10270 [Legionellales bacterium]|nr:hypothetical protein [Legionellales bacterium]
MNNVNQRIPLEMSMHNLDVELSKLFELTSSMDESDKIYLKELSLRLNSLSEQLNQPRSYIYEPTHF